MRTAKMISTKLRTKMDRLAREKYKEMECSHKKKKRKIVAQLD